MILREMIRLATRLQHHWQLGLERQRMSVVPLASIISPYVKRLRHAEQLLNLARSHGLDLIAPSLEAKVLYHARCLRITLQDNETVHFPLRRQFHLRDFYQDLLQLEQEFADVGIDWDNSQLYVQTETIILEDVDLGISRSGSTGISGLRNGH